MQSGPGPESLLETALPNTQRHKTADRMQAAVAEQAGLVESLLAAGFLGGRSGWEKAVCFLPGAPSFPNALPTGRLRAASALHFSKPQTRRSVPSDTVPSEGHGQTGTGQMKGVSSTQSLLSHGPHRGHVPAAASHPPECLSLKLSQAKTSLGSQRQPVLPSCSCLPGAQATGDTMMGRGTVSCSLRTAATLGPGLCPLNNPPSTFPPQGTIFARLTSSERRGWDVRSFLD